MKGGVRGQLIVFGFVLIFAGSIKAQNIIRSDIQIGGGEFSYQSSFSFQVGRNQQDGVRDLGSSMGLNFIATRNSDNTYLLLALDYQQQLANNDSRTSPAGDFRDPYIEIGRPITVLPIDLIRSQNFAIGGSIASSEPSREQGKLSSLSLSYSLTADINSKFKISQQHRLTRSFYNTEVSLNGLVNKPWAYSMGHSLVLDLNSYISLSANFIYGINRSFQNVLRDSFSTDYRALVELTKSVDLYMGVASLGMPTTGADGREFELRLFDDVQPTLYVGLAGRY